MSFALKPIDKRIQIELNRRAKVLSRDSSAISGESESQNNISNELRTLNSRTTWIRWISGDDKPAVILGGLALTDAGETLYRLAKGFEEVYVPPNTPTVHRWDVKTPSLSPSYKPVAGVKSVSTGFEGATKSVRKITVTWTVFDLDELEILTPHFLSPGKWAMLEMGWNYDGINLQNLHGTTLLEAKTGDDLTNKYNSLEEQIWANKGNYECLTGVISNFEYTLRDDGGFDCTTTMTTHGISLLDATIDAPSYPVKAVLDDAQEGTEVDKAEQKKEMDTFKEAINKLGDYCRVVVTIKQAKKDGSNNFLPLKDTPYNRYDPGGSDSSQSDYRIYGDPAGNYFLQVKKLTRDLPGNRTYSSFDYSLKHDVPTWVRWGWIEDNIISKYLGFATFEMKDGKPDQLKEIKLQFRSIDETLKTNALGAKLAPEKDMESVKIISHKNLLTTDINKFILVGKTPTLGKDMIPGNDVIGNFLDSADNLYKFEDQNVDETDKREGYLRNVYFNLRFIQEKAKAASTLRQFIDGIWNAVNAEYQQYWDFKIVGDNQDLTTIKIIDTNNSRYSVSNFHISSDSEYSCYQFPTWTKESIVKNMDYSVTIPSSQVAVAALSGGDIQVDQPADRHKGDISVQQYQKFLQKSFKENKNTYFKNVDRIGGKTRNSQFGQKVGDENKLLQSTEGIDIFNSLKSRGVLYPQEAGAVAEVRAGQEGGSGKTELQVINIGTSGGLFNPYFNDESTSTPLYHGGKMSKLGFYEHPKITMLSKLHGNEGTAKTTLFDLLNGISEIKLTIDGIAGIYPGDAFTSKHLPNHLLRPLEGTTQELPLLFQTTNVEHELTSNGWNTTISGMPRLNHNKLYKQVEPTEGKGVDDITTSDIKEFVDTRNILGIGGVYLDHLQMWRGVYLPLSSDPYFYVEVKGAINETQIIDPRGMSSTHALEKAASTAGVRVKHTTLGGNSLGINQMITKLSPGGKVNVMQPGMTSKDRNFGWYNDGSGGRTGSETHKYRNQGWKASDVRDTAQGYEIARNVMATFGPEVKVEEALWFSMYNGILFALPPIKTRDASVPWSARNLSEDGTFKNMSYHLFNGAKKSTPNIFRKKLTMGTYNEGGAGTVEYTPEYMEEFGLFGGYAPSAFYAGYNPGKSEIDTNFAKDKKLFTYDYIKGGVWSQAMQQRKDTATVKVVRGEGWKDWIYGDVDASLYLLKLTTTGRAEFKKFFENMYKRFVGKDLTVILAPSAKKNPDYIEKYANLFIDFANFDIMENINKFLDGMVNEGIIISPTLMYSKVEGLSYDRTSKGGISLQEDFIQRTIKKEKDYIERLHHLYEWDYTKPQIGVIHSYLGHASTREGPAFKSSDSRKGPLIYSPEKMTVDQIGRGHPPDSFLRSKAQVSLSGDKRKAKIEEWYSKVPSPPGHAHSDN